MGAGASGGRRLTTTRARLSLAVGGALLASPVLADEPTPVAPVVVTAQLSAARIDPASGASRSSDTAELLTTLAGVDAEAGGGFSSRPVIHGLSDERINILVGGVSIALACPNHMNPPLSYAAPQSITQAAVIAGVSPVSLGGDSLGATLLVDTAPARFADRGRTLVEGGAGAWYRSNGGGKGGFLDATLASDRLSLSYAGSAAQSGDYWGGGADGRVRSTSYETFDQSLALAGRTALGRFDLKLSAQTAPYEAFPNAFMDMTLNDSWALDGGWSRDFGWGQAKARLFHRETLHRMNFLADKGGSMGGGMPMRNVTISSGALVETDVRLSTAGVLRLGADVRRDQLSDVWAPVAGNPMEGPSAFINMEHGVRARAGAFVEWESAWTPTLSTVLGVRGDGVWMDAGQVHPYAPGLSMADDMAAQAFNAASRRRSDTHIDAAALARWRPTAGAAFELGVSRKTRSPSLYERYAWSQSSNSQMTGWFGDGNGYVGDVGLKPEVAHTASASAVLSGAGVHAWSLQLNPYYTRVQDYIAADALGPIGGMMGAMGSFELLQFANHRVEIYGADLSGSVRLTDSQALGQTALEASAGWVRGTNLDTDMPLYHMPPLKGRVQLTHVLGPWSSRLELTGAEAKTRVDMTRMEPTTPSHLLVNLGTAYSWGRLKVELGVDNLFDRAWAPPLGGLSLGDYSATGLLRPLPGRGRSVNFALSSRF